MTLDELPTFTVNHIERDRAVGVVDRALWMGERHHGDLLLPDGRFVGGRFVSVDLQSLSASFVPTAAHELALLHGGQAYRRFDGYWGERAALVLDRDRGWTQRTFGPVDAVAYKSHGDTLVGKATNQNLPEGGTLIKGGWDHEHCDICWEAISPTDRCDCDVFRTGPLDLSQVSRKLRRSALAGLHLRRKFRPLGGRGITRRCTGPRPRSV